MTLINLVNLIIGGNVWFKISTVRKSNGINSHRLYGGFMDPPYLTIGGHETDKIIQI